MRRCLTAAVLLLASRHAGAQAPRISAAGDPSVRADTIYKLSVDPKAFPEQGAAFLLDDGVVRLEADGRGTRTYRQIVQVLKPSAVEGLQEQSWSYSPRHQKLRVNWVRVLRLDGTVISAKPAHVQEADVPAEDDGPVYSDRRVRRASLTGVAPGTIVDYSYTIEETKPFLKGDFYDTWGVSTGLQVARSRYVVDVPASVAVRLREVNLNFKRKETVANGRHIYEWSTANLPKIKPELLAADSNGVYMSLAVSSPTSWDDIGRWYAALAKPHSTATKLVNARVDSIVRGARTRDDSIAAIHRWVAQDIRYVAIDLGMSGYQPRAPETVVHTGFGDCKDKATLFVAALEHIGVQAFPVLLNSTGDVRREMPSIAQFNHEIAAIKRGDRYQYVDLTASLVPLGELPFSEQGEFGLIVRPDGSSEPITLPKAPLTANRTDTRITGTLSAEGMFNGTYEEASVGAAQYGLRNLLENPLDSAQRRNIGNGIAAKLFESAEGDSLWGTNGKDLAIPPKVNFQIRGGRAATPAGANMILHFPLPNMSGMVAAAKELSEAEKRRFPIDPTRLWGERMNSVDIRITLPAGWRPDLPKSVTANSEFGRYDTQYAIEGQVLHISRSLSGVIGVQPPEKISALVEWLRAVGADDAKFIVLTKAAGAM